MRYLQYAGSLIFGMLLAPFCQAQADGLVAYVPDKPIERTADNERIAFVSGAVAGKVEALIPENAQRIDILNARGNVKHTYATEDMDLFSIGDLRPGTWTLRVHTSDKLLVRRFVVMQRGSIVWTPAGPVRKR